jgi:GntR family transcriptional repressor for pyruvate dehydrogenase complex
VPDERDRATAITGVTSREETSHRFSSVATETLSRKITREIITSIIEGHYRPGDLLPTEEELSQQLGVSRPVVREATKAVTMLGMLRSRQGRGTEVLPDENWNEFAPEVLETRRDVQTVDEFLTHLLELRRIIEVEAAALAAERASETDVDEIGSFLDAMAQVGDDRAAFAAIDVGFHDAILAATGNRPLRSLLRSIEPALLAARTMSLSSRPAGVERSTREHQAILKAIADGSPVAARKAMSSHLSWTADLSLDLDA